MIRSSITICLVPAAAAGPFVYHNGLEDGCRRARAAGFDAVELMIPSAGELDVPLLRQSLAEHGLALSGLMTGAGWVVRQLSLTSPDPAIRRAAIEFICDIIDLAGELHAPAILGSMQGRWVPPAGGQPGVPLKQALEWLAESLRVFDQRAAACGQVFLYEPLNRYESNLFNRQLPAWEFLLAHGLKQTRLLCDLFHMNLEEDDLAAALVACGAGVGHVHFADSQRRAMGTGHTALGPIVKALATIGYEGYLTAEIFPLPDADTAARQTIEAFRRGFPSGSP